MEQNDKKKLGEADALKDWNNKQVDKLFSGDIYIDSPLIDDNGFYLTSSYEKKVYVQSYNAMIKKKIALNGIPDWAPGSRVLSEKQVDEIFKLDSQRNFDVDFLPNQKRKEVRNFVLRLRDKYGVMPDLYAYYNEKKILLYITTTTNGTLYADTFDLHYECWMQTFELKN